MKTELYVVIDAQSLKFGREAKKGNIKLCNKFIKATLYGSEEIAKDFVAQCIENVNNKTIPDFMGEGVVENLRILKV
jgi:hypothetical protein